MELTGFIGNEPLKRTLSGMERPSHAVIISGAKGSGRHTLARLLAQAHICTGKGIPCGVCPNCRKVAEGIHPDVLTLANFVEPSDLEKEVRVSTIRDIRSDAQIRPNQAGRKVYLIDQPINQNAQNAMLKLLEEGPAYACFLILTENSAALLETVRSRCALLRTIPVTTAQAAAYLAQRYPEQDRNAVFQAAEAGQGLIGRSMELLEGTGEDESTAVLADQWQTALLSRDELALMRCAVAVQTQKLSRDSTERLYLALSQRLRDALVCASHGAQYPSEGAQRLASAYPTAQLLALYRACETAREMCLSNVAPGHSAGWLAVELAGK